MTWVMVLIMVTSTSVHAERLDEYQSLWSCFEGREVLINSLGGKDGIPPNGIQAVCIPTGSEL